MTSYRLVTFALGRTV